MFINNNITESKELDQIENQIILENREKRELLK